MVLYICLFAYQAENQQSRKEQTVRLTHYRKPTNLYKQTVGNGIDKLFKYTGKRNYKHNTTF